MQLDHQKQYKLIATLTKTTQMITYMLCIPYNKNIHCIFKLVNTSPFHSSLFYYLQVLTDLVFNISLNSITII